MAVIDADPALRPQPTETPTRRADIQGMRAIAVLLVVVYHANAPLPGGFVGVDVFFVVSGYVITAMLAREVGRSGRLRLSTFYLRRSRRLLPALATMLTVVLVASVFLAPLGAQARTRGTGVAASLFVANIYLISLGKGGYFQTAARSNPLLHTWSLSLEEQFYLVFPTLILLAALAVRRRPGLQRKALFVAVAAMSIVSFGLCLAITDQRIPIAQLTTAFAFYTAPTRVWQFGVGALLALVAARWPRGRTLAEASFWIGMALVVWSAFAYGAFTRFPGAAAAVPTVGAALVIAAGIKVSGVGSGLLATRPMVWIGDRSYSWYLWHWPIIVFAVAVWPDVGWVAAAAAALSVVPAWASYRWLEQPIRLRRAKPAQTLRLAVICISVPIVTALLMSPLGHAVERTERVASFREQVGLHADAKRGCNAGAPRLPNPRCTWPLPAGVADRSASGRSGNLLVGDSNAGQFSDVFIEASHRQGRAATIQTRGVCPFVDLVVVREGFADEGCRKFVSAMLDEIVAARPDAVVMASATDGYLNSSHFGLEAPDGTRATTPAAKARMWEGGLARVVDRLREADIPVVMATTIPKFPSWNPQECAVVRVLVAPSSCGVTDSKRAIEDRRRLAVATEAAVAEKRPGVVIVDPDEDLCPGDPCSAERDGRWWWMDGNHVSIEGAEVLAPRFDAALEKVHT